LHDLTAVLGGLALAEAGLASDIETGAAAIADAIADGRAAETFARMVAAQGGPLRFVEDWARFLPEASVIREVAADRAGYVSAMDTQAMGLIVVRLGGGRQVEGDRVNPAVGLSDIAALGTWVEKGQPLARVHALREPAAAEAIASLRAAITLSDSAPNLPPLIRERVG
jgi:thymidine phosphorylase